MFEAERPLLESYASALDQSRCCIIPVSGRFFTYGILRTTFDNAYLNLVNDPDRKLLLVLLLNTNVRELMENEDCPADFKGMLQARQYVSVGERFFWDKLFHRFRFAANIHREDDEVIDNDDNAGMDEMDVQML